MAVAARDAASMSLRHKAREYTLQMLFEWEVGRQQPERVEAGFWKSARADKKTRAFANHLFEGAVAEVVALDDLIGRHTVDWRVERLAAIDRAILRLAGFELRERATPPKVVINEAVELAKKFSSQEAVPFMNGILDAIYKSLNP